MGQEVRGRGKVCITKCSNIGLQTPHGPSLPPSPLLRIRLKHDLGAMMIIKKLNDPYSELSEKIPLRSGIGGFSLGIC
jgi:hypothetical protein